LQKLSKHSLKYHFLHFFNKKKPSFVKW